MALEHKLEKVENAVFETLMESVLKFSKLLDVGVFLLVEDRYRKRRYGGSKEFCDAFEENAIHSRIWDVHVEMDSLDSSVRECIPRSNKRGGGATDDDALLVKKTRVETTYEDVDNPCPFLMDADEHDQESFFVSSLTETFLPDRDDSVNTYEAGDISADVESTLYDGDAVTIENNDGDLPNDEDFEYSSDKSDSSDEDRREKTTKNQRRVGIQRGVRKLEPRTKTARCDGCGRDLAATNMSRHKRVCPGRHSPTRDDETDESDDDGRERTSKERTVRMVNASNEDPTGSNTLRKPKPRSNLVKVRDSIRFSVCSEDEENCDESAASQRPTLSTDATRHFSTQQTFDCDSCSASFKWRNHLTSHNRSIHGIYDDDSDWDG